MARGAEQDPRDTEGTEGPDIVQVAHQLSQRRRSARPLVHQHEVLRGRPRDVAQSSSEEQVAAGQQWSARTMHVRGCSCSAQSREARLGCDFGQDISFSCRLLAQAGLGDRLMQAQDDHA